MIQEKLDDFLYNSSIGIHSVAADGTIEYANQCELDNLGYLADEYIGHSASEFQLDKPCLEDMLDRLGRFEELKNYPARVKGKDGTVYLLYNSSVYKQDGEFIHTRCFANKIDEDVYQVFRQTSPYIKALGIDT